ncbi:hypothetical protein [Kitasatospora acidiphila]|uniref:hypothetical protein n=1 Tax=Kitasatospora acidiphila TaxID=2567942 RepID=UPI003C76902E
MQQVDLPCGRVVLPVLVLMGRQFGTPAGERVAHHVLAAECHGQHHGGGNRSQQDRTVDPGHGLASRWL